MKHPESQFICDISGFKKPRSRAKKMWNGLLVDKDEWEPRHPQDFTNPVKSPKPIKDARPSTDPVFQYGAGVLLDSNGDPILDSDGQYILVG